MLPAALGANLLEGWLDEWPHAHYSRGGTPFVHLFASEPAFMDRDFFLDFALVNGKEGMEYEVEAEIEYALTRRIGIVIEAPYSYFDPDEGARENGLGDLAIAPRFLLLDYDRFLLSANIEFSFPTGDADRGFGAGETNLAPRSQHGLIRTRTSHLSLTTTSVFTMPFAGVLAGGALAAADNPPPPTLDTDLFIIPKHPRIQFATTICPMRHLHTLSNITLLPLVLALTIAPAQMALAQWHSATGTTALNMQSLLSQEALVLAGGATGAYRSTDSASSFVLSNSGNDAVGPTRGFTADRSYIYTCTSQGVFRSANSGMTWIAKSSGMTNLLTSGIVQAEAKLFVVGPSGVFRSDNQGDNWTAAGLTGIDTRCIAAIDSTLFAGTNGGGVYKSTNWGAAWTAVNTGLASTNIRALEAKGTTLFAGGQVGTGVYRSTDLGTSWTLLAGGLPSGSYRGFAHDDRLIVAGSFGGGVLYSLNNGAQWTLINTGLSNLQVFDLEIHDGFIVAATNTQGVFRYALSNLADLDNNGCVEAADLSILLGAWGICADCKADQNGDGAVDAVDLSLLLSNWGACG